MRSPARALAVAPLLILAAAALGSSIVGMLPAPAPSPLRQVAMLLPVAAGATLICLVLALAICLTRPAAVWGLPIWIGPGPALVGWSLVPVAPNRALSAAEIGLVLLPVAVFFLRDSGLPVPGLWRIASWSGAGRFASLVHVVLSPIVPDLVRAGLVVASLSLGLLASLP